jgi:16S rRNA (uracil1498-N3)-methyltransferase
MHLFYHPAFNDGIHRLSEEESKHAVRVMRMGAGSKAELTDGRGTRALIELTDTDKRGCSFKVISSKTTPKPQLPNIAIAPTKNMDRFEWFLEKAVEIGVSRICPIRCVNSERNVLKTERCEKILLAAMKQSQRDWLPEIDELTTFSEFIEKFEGQLFIAHCRDGMKQPYTAPPAPDAWIMIGPEGDFTEQEIKRALSKGAHPVSLGNSRLRTETAGIFALTVMNFLACQD